MYQAEPAETQVPAARLLRSALPVSRNVWFLGLTSLFTDISSEMVASILPAYLVLHLGVSPLLFGAVDGLYQGVGSIVRWIGGAFADRTRRHKELAAIGYAVSAVCRLALLLAGNAWAAVTAIVAVDRIGKGFRTAPRDALISLSVAPRDLATAFGLHRALDALGALLGPIVAFAILFRSPRAFDQVFVVSFSVAIVGLALIVLFVENVKPLPASTPRMATVLTEPLRDRDFRRTLMLATALALATVSDAFVYLVLQRRANFGPQFFPLLAAGTAISYVVWAFPAGRLADRIGRIPVFVAGHVALLVLYAMLLPSQTSLVLGLSAVLLLGAYYAMTDGVLAAAASTVLPARVRATGLAVLATAVSLARLTASLLFGWAWSLFGPSRAIAGFGIAMTIGIALAWVWRRHLERPDA